MFFKKLSTQGKEYLQQLEEDALPFVEEEQKQMAEFEQWLSNVFSEARKKQEKSPDQKNESDTQ